MSATIGPLSLRPLPQEPTSAVEIDPTSGISYLRKDNDEAASSSENTSSVNFTGIDTDHVTGNRPLALLLLVFPVLTVFGNVLVCLSVVKEQSLRTLTNYFIVSLAVADIMVAILVMPFAVYVEFNDSHWLLGNTLCDTWVACDVMCCTASILNLTGISIDRFIAVTYPISYARHKNSKRLYLTIALIWIISIGISSPIVLGINYSERRDLQPTLCTFYNAEFLIFSSMGSFYIPCLAMLILYWRIFYVIRKRNRQQHPHGPRNRANSKSKVNTKPSSSSVNVTKVDDRRTSKVDSVLPTIEEEALLPKPLVHFDAIRHIDDEEDEEFPATKSGVFRDKEEVEHRLLNVAGAFVSPNGISSPVSPSATSLALLIAASAAPDDHRAAREKEGEVGPGSYGVELSSCAEPMIPTSERRTSTSVRISLKWRMAIGRMRRERNSREKKAAKTLAIVIGIFLLCWVPFFTISIISAICIQYEAYSGFCQIHPMLFAFFVWLGYINSFLNPIIYTIFNVEFRKAFSKILHLRTCPSNR